MADHGQGLMMRQRRCTIGARRCEVCPARPRPSARRRRAESSASRTTLWRRVQSGDFPAPVRLGGNGSRAVGWRRADIERWLKALPKRRLTIWTHHDPDGISSGAASQIQRPGTTTYSRVRFEVLLGCRRLTSVSQM